MTVADGLVVLVVEDHDFQRRTIARMLRSLGVADVLEAGDGTQALALIHESARAPVDVVVCDLDMPGMDGIELLRHLGQERIPVSVVISSGKERALLNSVQKMARAYGVRLLGVIEKPVTRVGLEELIAQHQAPTASAAHSSACDPSFSLDQILDGMQHQQFEPFFQPKVALDTGRIAGAEALARWRHPEHGLIGPHAFIALLEQGEKIDELTFQILEKAADACRSWIERGLDLTVSVNLSLVSLIDTTIADRITQAVRSIGLDPPHMILEITETTAMTEVAPVLENLTRLRMRGFGLSVDDYGTGFSSLQQLTRVPFTEIKIDQGFVAGCAANDSLRAIVESSVQMAQRLGITSVAEGIETQADWDALKNAACELAQGHFIARPMAGSSFMEFCATRKAGQRHRAESSLGKPQHRG